jgi:hypothetical protein
MLRQVKKWMLRQVKKWMLRQVKKWRRQEGGWGENERQYTQLSFNLPKPLLFK